MYFICVLVVPFGNTICFTVCSPFENAERTYRGSNILSGADVLGKKMKLDSGNTGIFLGRLFLLIIIIILSKAFKNSTLIIVP